MKKLLLGFILCILTISYSHATHIRAGDLVVKRISTFTYEFVFTLYRDTDGIPATQSGVFDFGDGSSEEPGTNLIFVDNIGNKTDIYRYTTTHTYGAAGRYTVSYKERNRNDGVNNISSSIETPFYIETSFLISSGLNLNQSPVLLIPPIDFANVGQRFIHNPGAFDFEGDSLSYRLTVCKQDKGVDVDGYTFPGNSKWSTTSENGGAPNFSIDAFTGDLIWDAPGVCGEYNVAFFVDEWRNGVLIGSVNRDMQITVLDSDNIRPKFDLPADTCIIAGQKLEAVIKAFDEDASDQIQITNPQLTDIQGGIFNLQFPSQPAQFFSGPGNSNEAEATFIWQTNCNDIRSQPYQATFKVQDSREAPSSTHGGACLTNGPLSDLQTWRIRVVAPPPNILSVTPNITENDITVEWEPYTNICHPSLLDDNTEITIWRREGSFNFTPDNCTTGIPSFAGYQKIGTVEDLGVTTFTDENLESGKTYCYRLVVDFPSPRNTESLASDEMCAYIPDNSILITKTSILETDLETGRVEINWTPPLNEDEPGGPAKPYTYQVLRSETFNGEYLPIFNTPISERTFIDTGAELANGLNTTENPYFYKIAFYSNGTRFENLDSKLASTVRLSAVSGDNSILLSWIANVPWSNATQEYEHDIYRVKIEEGIEPEFGDTPIATISPLDNGFIYVDDDPTLEKGGINYLYRVITRGYYDNPPDIVRPIVNISQDIASSLDDDEAPCPPSLTLINTLCEDLGEFLTNDSRSPEPDEVESVCSKLYDNRLEWTIAIDETAGCIIRDISHYQLFFKPYEDGEFVLIQDNIVRDESNLVYVDTDLTSIAGCYGIKAVDFSGNPSEMSIMTNSIACQDNCPDYYLPNAFSPTVTLGKNDTFRAFPCHRFVESVNFTVYNRWGKLIFESNDNVDIEWDGKGKNGKDVPSGVYFYQAEVRFKRLRRSDEVQKYKGTITVLK